MARPNLRLEATTARLSGLRLPEGGGWVHLARTAAYARLEAMGLPVRRDEYWRFTDPTSLTAPDPAPAAPMIDDEGPSFAEVGALRLVFVDGRFDAEASDPAALEHIELERLSDAATRDLHWAQGLYGVLEAEGQKPVPRPLATLNTAFAEEGLLIRVTGEAARPVHLVYRHLSEASDAILHHLVKVEAGASLTLLESGPAAARFNNVLEVDVADGASFHHVRTQGRDRERRAATHIFARIGKGATFRSFTLTFNGVLTRNEAFLTLAGDNAVAHVAGAAVGDGDFHHDDTVFITHAGLACESRQVFKKVLRNGATGVFQGKILVKPGAQKTDGYQLSQALLLDEKSQFLAKPELEIYADDVACSHGSTAGAIDETALFYLRSRGVPQRDAMDLLTLAFLREALEEIADERLVADLSARLEGWLGATALMGVLADIGRSLRHGPRAVVREQLAQGPNEARALAFLMIGCFLVWLAQLPRFAREVEANRLLQPPGPEFDQLAGTGFFSWMMLLPLVFYFLSWIVHLVSSLTGGQGTSFGARLAMFWSWLAASPFALLTGALAGFTGNSVLSNGAGLLWIAVFLAFWALSQREAAQGPHAHAI